MLSVALSFTQKQAEVSTFSPVYIGLTADSSSSQKAIKAKTINVTSRSKVDDFHLII